MSASLRKLKQAAKEKTAEFVEPSCSAIILNPEKTPSSTIKEVGISKDNLQSSFSNEILPEIVASNELTPDEERDKLHLERLVERAFYSAGKALRELRDRRLYRDTHTTFDDYCHDRFAFSRRQPYYLIDAANVFDNLAEECEPMVHILPTSERQVRPLASLKPQQQRKLWNQAVEEAGGRVPSGRIVKSIVDRIRERTKIPNPYQIGDICEILVKENPELRGKGGCWAIVRKVSDFGCTVCTWQGDCHLRIENLKSLSLSPSQQEEVRNICDRLTRLREIGSLDRGAEHFLSGLGKHLYLTEVEEKLLATLEKHYCLLPYFD